MRMVHDYLYNCPRSAKEFYYDRLCGGNWGYYRPEFQARATVDAAKFAMYRP
jgi:hypothetical protein